jgi:hypothetical protein
VPGILLFGSGPFGASNGGGGGLLLAMMASRKACSAGLRPVGLDACLAPHRFRNLGAGDGALGAAPLPFPSPAPSSELNRLAEDRNVREAGRVGEDRVVDVDKSTRRES